MFFYRLIMELLLIYMLIGSAAGLLGGLFGLGGGAVVVPVLIYTFTLTGINELVLTHLAIGTSLATIVVTSLSSIYTHQRNRAVLWRVSFWMAPGIGIGVIAGGVLATEMSGARLQMLFGMFLAAVAVQMLAQGHPRVGRDVPDGYGSSAAGAGIGFLSGIFGIGGGSLSVPYLTWCNVPIARAIATSAALGFPIALFGALTFMYRGWGAVNLPEGAWGYVFAPAFAGIALTSIPSARLGAQLAHRLPAARLKKLFALIIFVLGVVLIVTNLET